MENTKETSPVLSKAQKIVGWILWLITVLVGIAEILLVRAIVIELFIRFFERRWVDVVGIVTVLITAVAILAYAMWVGETLYANKKIPWKHFILAGAVEILVLILYFLV